MPFLWKKVKSTRISRLVNDHLHNSQKRRDGSSLVVETGFPTSLIDLFIKNREKLKSPSKKKRRSPPIRDADDQLIVGSSPPFTPPPPPPPSLAGSLTPSHSPLRCPSPLHNLSVLPPPSRCVGEISAVGEKDGDDEKVVADVNNVLFGVLKIFLVVVLALGTKRFAVGITISAFLLLFIEYVGRHSAVVSRLLRFKLDEKKKENEVLKIKSLDQEIQEVEESKCEEIQPVIEITDEPSFGHQESEAIGKEVKKKSRKGKIKSRMKKYVTKKFTSSRKQNELQRPEEQVDQCNNVGESGNTSSFSSSFSSSNSWRMYRDEDGAAREVRLSEVTEEANTKTEVEAAAGLTWRHLALCLIVLIGLLGGRAFALMLTLSCFLVLKLGQNLPRFIYHAYQT